MLKLLGFYSGFQYAKSVSSKTLFVL